MSLQSQPILVLSMFFSPTYGVKLIQQLHEVFLELKDDFLTLEEEKVGISSIP